MTHGRRWQHDVCQTCQTAITYSPRYGWRHDDETIDGDMPVHAASPSTPGKTGHISTE